ncbi:MULTISPECIES: hypothetical protein [Kamptonema]|uniref:hypothetical protein n=1 Tax=Kamptonema TaxID=1501433 RepID=UPI0001DAC332|nr:MULTISPECIES: hypothetical protein [Kamptonema]CBN58995.1 hypothetical protein OSCI_3980010 [Kamptonema sp. PCC 6506]
MNQLPNQTPDPFDTNQPSNRFDPQNLAKELDRENVDRPVVYHPDTKKVLQKVFIMLIVGGVIVGGILSIGILKLMKNYGLTDVPPREEKAR